MERYKLEQGRFYEFMQAIETTHHDYLPLDTFLDKQQGNMLVVGENRPGGAILFRVWKEVKNI